MGSYPIAQHSFGKKVLKKGWEAGSVFVASAAKGAIEKRVGWIAPERPLKVCGSGDHRGRQYWYGRLAGITLVRQEAYA
jgi:hypothetical protein